MSVQQALIASASSTDPYAAFRVTIANLDVNLSDPKRTWTAGGNAAVSGGWLNLDGTGDYLQTPNSTAFDFGSGDFCVEAFVEIASAPPAADAVVAKWTAAAPSWLLVVNASGALTFHFYDSNFRNVSAGTIPTGSSVHLAGYRNGGSIYCAVNGVVGTPYSIGVNSLAARNIATVIGAESDLSSSAFAGKIRGVRVTKGSSGGYGASNFMPPSFPLPTS